MSPLKEKMLQQHQNLLIVEQDDEDVETQRVQGNENSGRGSLTRRTVSAMMRKLSKENIVTMTDRNNQGTISSRPTSSRNLNYRVALQHHKAKPQLSNYQSPIKSKDVGDEQSIMDPESSLKQADIYHLKQILIDLSQKENEIMSQIQEQERNNLPNVFQMKTEEMTFDS